MSRKMKFAFVILAIGLVTLLTGCKVTYSHNFVSTQSLTNDSGTWSGIGMDYSFTPKGLYLQTGAIACPIKFKGDFECTFEFETDLPTSDADYLNFTFFMIEGNVLMIDRFAGIVTEYYDLPTAKHKIGQGPVNFIWDNRSWGPDGMVNGTNEFTIIRTGNMIDVQINGTSTWYFALDDDNVSEYFRPYVNVYHSGFTPGAGFYLRKVSVKYEKGNSI